MTPTTVLIIGANKGIDKGLLELYLAKSNHTIVVVNRNPAHATSRALDDLPKTEDNSILIIKIDAVVSTNPVDAVKQLAQYDIDYLNIVIANARIAYVYPKVSEIKIENMQKHTIPNTYGVI